MCDLSIWRSGLARDGSVLSCRVHLLSRNGRDYYQNGVDGHGGGGRTSHYALRFPFLPGCPQLLEQVCRERTVSVSCTQPSVSLDTPSKID